MFPVGHALIAKVDGIIFVLICSFVLLHQSMAHWLTIMSMLLISATSKEIIIIIRVHNYLFICSYVVENFKLNKIKFF